MFCNKFKQFRDTYRYSQSEVAQKIGVSQSFVSQLERGLRLPNSKTLHLILALFKISKENLFEGEYQQNNKTRLCRIIDNLSDKQIEILTSVASHFLSKE